MGKRLNQPQGFNPNNKIGITTTIVQCNNCGLIFSNPQPIPFDIQAHYGVPPEDYWKENYFVSSENDFKTEINTLKKIMEIKQGMKSLDVGAGLGKAMLALTNEGFDAYGFEPSLPFYERAISKMKLLPHKLKLGMLEEVDYPLNEFDFITFGAVLEHLYNPSEAITKAITWLKPNGIIHIEVPSSNWLTNKLINLICKLRFTNYVANISPMHSPFHLYEFGAKSFAAHAQLHNYKVVLIEHHVCETFMPRFLDFIIKPIMKYTNTGLQMTIWLQKK